MAGRGKGGLWGGVGGEIGTDRLWLILVHAVFDPTGRIRILSWRLATGNCSPRARSRPLNLQLDGLETFSTSLRLSSRHLYSTSHDCAVSQDSHSWLLVVRLGRVQGFILKPTKMAAVQWLQVQRERERERESYRGRIIISAPFVFADF